MSEEKVVTGGIELTRIKYPAESVVEFRLKISDIAIAKAKLTPTDRILLTAWEREDASIADTLLALETIVRGYESTLTNEE